MSVLRTAELPLAFLFLLCAEVREGAGGGVAELVD